MSGSRIGLGCGIKDNHSHVGPGLAREGDYPQWGIFRIYASFGEIHGKLLTATLIKKKNSEIFRFGKGS